LEFFLNTNVIITFFQNLALFWVKNAKLFAKFIAENILKIITSVPDVKFCWPLWVNSFGF
jgi:hypothetical protein